MSKFPKHIKWLVDTGERVATKDGKVVEVWELQHQPDDKVLSAWAKHFRNHYCSDDEIDNLRFPYSRTDYLRNHIFPDSQKFPGSITRAGDFGEILVADFFEYVLDFWVPRVRYQDKPKRNLSTPGVDIIGFKTAGDTESPNDQLAVVEVKTHFAGKKSKNTLQEAVNHSIKDQVRKAESLNWIKRRVLKNTEGEAKAIARRRIERFQTPLDKPYQEVSGAATVISNKLYDDSIVAQTLTSHHPNNSDLYLIVIRGKAMMDLVHTLYERAADEA